MRLRNAAQALVLLALALLRRGAAVAGGEEERGEDEALAPGAYDAMHLWSRVATEEWQPGRGTGNSTNLSKHPIKDLECEGPQTRIGSIPGVDWAMLKEGWRQNIAQKVMDPMLAKIGVLIVRQEPDECVLGVTTASASLLPITFPKFRNMARMLSTDQNFLDLSTDFYDVLRSGFPIFGVLDGLATEEYRAWFGTSESYEFFPTRAAPPACDDQAALALLKEVEKGRNGGWARTPLLPAIALFADGGHVALAGGCPLAAAAALIVSALVRAEGVQLGGDRRGEALRDVIELVSRAEEIVRAHAAEERVSFGELVASPWNIWWLLDRLQLALPQRLFASSEPGGR